MNWHEILRTASAVVGALAVAFVTYLGHVYTKAIGEREIQGQFVTLSVQILQSEPTNETQELRKWATKVINEYSGVPLDEAEAGLWDFSWPTMDPFSVPYCFLIGDGQSMKCFESMAECQEGRATILESEKLMMLPEVGDCQRGLRFEGASSWKSN